MNTREREKERESNGATRDGFTFKLKCSGTEREKEREETRLLSNQYSRKG